MEQAVNMFTGGMVLDSHPLVQSSDTLSDALNATYITMNGNEVVLQNDMGNRRVDNAYLPAGYEPVGIKEHGGIIYIAAYNPITHRSQIGSFPSPERNMGTEYKDNGTKFDLTDFIGNENIIRKDGIKYLKDDTLLQVLTSNTSLHAGDKFTVYSGDVWNWGNKGLLTNFGTEELGIPQKYSKTPSNSYVTLSLGIMNSQNEFSDITPSLERFNSNGNIIKGLDIDKDKFNTGYFIAPDTWKNLNGLTSNDATLINEREKIGANTYAYKLTGPLYLKAELNHIQTFSYSMDMSKTLLEGGQSFKIDLYITGTATYNCPDSGEDNGQAYFNSFKLFYKSINSSHPDYSNENEGTILSKELRAFDSTSGIYTSTIVKHFIFELDINQDSAILNYLVAVPLFHYKKNVNILDNDQHTLDEYNIFISQLSEAGSLDISKIGSNECELEMWKYKNTIENNKVTSTLLNYRFDCYRDLETSFKDLEIELINQTTPSQTPFKLNDLIAVPSEISTGRQEFLIDWTAVEQDKRINFQDLYLAKITYNQYTGVQPPVKKTLYRFILGTSLFNPCFDESNENDYTSDFGIFMGEYDASGYYQYNLTDNGDRVTQNIPASIERNELRNKYLNLWDKITIKEDPELYSTFKSSTIGGSKPISKTQPIFNQSDQLNTYRVKIKYNTDWKIEDKDLLIKSIELTHSNTSVTISEEGLTSDKEVNIVKKLNNQQYNEQTYLDNIVVMPTSGEINNNTTDCIISFPIYLYDKIYIAFKEETRIIGKAYVDVNNYTFRNDLIKLMSQDQRYMCIRNQCNSSHDGGYDAYVNAEGIYGANAEVEGWGVQDHSGTIWLDIFNNYGWFGNHNYNIGDFYDAFIKPFFKKMKCPFTFGLCATPDSNDEYHFRWNEYVDEGDPGFYQVKASFPPMVYNRDVRVVNHENGCSGCYYTRVWWVDEDGNPCLLNNYDSSGLFSGYGTEDKIKNDIYEEILRFIGEVKVGNTFYSLVAPLKNYPFKGYYASTDSYLYSENTKVTLNVNLNYRLQKTTKVSDDPGVTYYNKSSCCLQFYLDPGKTQNYKDIKRDVNKNYYLGEYSQNVFNLAQLQDLSSYSIDLESGNIISDKEPIDHLYVRNDQTNVLKDVPKSYPLQINQGEKYSFPIVCKKKYNSYKNNIGFPYLVHPMIWSGSGPLSATQLAVNYTVNQGTEGDAIPWSRTVIALWPSTKQIPVLYNEDLVINNSNFFNT